MGGINPGTAREEAERLITTALAAVRLAAAGAGSGGSGAGPSSPLGSLGSLGPLGEVISGVLGGRSAGPSAAGSGPSAAGSGPSAAGDGAAEAADSATASDGGHFATGTAECCVCPICRAMVALRDPSPEFSERLATGAGDFAAGVASLLRAFSTATASSPTASGATASTATASSPTASGATAFSPTAPDSGTDTSAETGTPRPTPASRAEETGYDQMWREVTHTGHDSWAAPEPDVWAAATRTDRAGRSGGAGVPADAAGTPDAAGTADATGWPEATGTAGPAARTRIRSAGTRTMAHEAVDRSVVPASRTPTSGIDADDLSGDDA